MSGRSPRAKPRVLIVGAFPREGSSVVGGVLRNCDLLLQSRFPELYDLSLVDSTQRANPVPPFLRRLGYAVGRWRDLIRALVQDRPDHSLIFCGIGFSIVEKSLMALTSRAFGAKATLFPMGGQIIHESEGRPALTLWYRMMFSTPNTLFCQGRRWHAFFRDRLRIPEERLAIINSWTATPELLAAGAARELHTGDATTFVFIGWIEPEKGIRELLRAFARVAARFPARLDVVGGGSLDDEVRSFILSHQLEGRVTLHGWLSADEVTRVLTGADVFVLPSWGEGMPNSLIEAMATRTAAIVSEVGSVPDFIVDGESGILIQPKAEDELERALVRMITDREFRLSCAETAYEIAREKLTIENAIEQMQPIFGA